MSGAYAQRLEELDCVCLGSFVQRDEADVLGRERFVGEGALQGVQVVRAEGD